jgi:uncharacterized cupin superfamily protein
LTRCRLPDPCTHGSVRIMTRPSCVVHVSDLPGEPRPRWTPAPGIAATVRNLGDAVGLTHMGVHLRTVEPGNAGTNRHFHIVEEEWTYVLSGCGAVRVGPHRLPVRTGSFVGFPPGPRPHHFIAEGTEPLVLLEGGERRPTEDSGAYVDVDKQWRGGTFERWTAQLPPEIGDPSQSLHIDDVPDRSFQHPVDAQARRVMRRLNHPAGLLRQAVVWTRVQPGDRSTAFHTHDRTDEWIFVLSGRAQVRVGEERFEIGPYDFVGHAAGSPAHVMEPLEPLTYLMGGEINPDDVVIYPDAGVRRVHGKLEPLESV